MNPDNALSRLQEVLTKGTLGVIVLPTNPSADAVAAATSLYLGLTKMGKSVSLACSSEVSFDLIATDKIQSNLVTSGNSLVVSFPYTEGAIDKVDYNIQGNSFNLIISPRQGYSKLEPNQVKYTYTGGALDFVIVIDSPTLNSLGTIYTDNQSQFQGKDIINIDRHLTNAFFGTVNFVNKTASSVSELVLTILQTLHIELDKNMATNLYAGIAASTNNFTSYSVTADTFETIATLMRAGALKKTIKKPGLTQPPKFNASPSFAPQRYPSKEQQPFDVAGTAEQEVTNEANNPSQDWLKPKIFKGSGGLV